MKQEVNELTKYVVFDKKGIIHESNDYDAALKEWEGTTEFEGDLIFAEVIRIRR
jgi:hypothetical protein